MSQLTFLFLASVLAFTAPSLAAGKKKSVHREHHAHVHGSAELAIAFEGKNGRIEFKAPGEGVLGFEHVAKSKKDKKTLSDAKARFQNASALFQFDASLGCKITADKVEVEQEGSHSTLIARYQVACEMPVSKTQMTVDFQIFPNIKDLDISVLSDSLQQSHEAKKTPISFPL